LFNVELPGKAEILNIQELEFCISKEKFTKDFALYLPDNLSNCTAASFAVSIVVADKTRLPLPAEIADNDTVSAMPTRSLHLLTRFSESLLFQGGGFDEFDQEGLVIGLLSFGANTNIHEDRSALATRTRAIRSAIDYVEQSDKESLLVSDVCASINIPLRTLRRAFHEKFGIGPKAYFNRVRLGQVRSELLNSERGLCIADAANEWGFWHMGQFARDYRTMFGELPSQTVDRRNPN